MKSLNDTLVADEILCPYKTVKIDVLVVMRGIFKMGLIYGKCILFCNGAKLKKQFTQGTRDAVLKFTYSLIKQAVPRYFTYKFKLFRLQIKLR